VRGREAERLGAGFGLSRATAYRYRDEVLGVLSNQAPDLREAWERAKAAGTAAEPEMCVLQPGCRQIG
jgi:hypothetical protein